MLFSVCPRLGEHLQADSVTSRLVVHDYAGHPFQVALSRELARRGHDVLHIECASYRSGKGALEVRPDDPSTLQIESIRMEAAFAKHAILPRIRQEVEYGRRVASRARAFKPDCVLSANAPLLTQWFLLRTCRRLRARFVFWLQDIISAAASRYLLERYPRAIALLAEGAVQFLEGYLLRLSDAVVAIADEFRVQLEGWQVSPERIAVIENWAPLDEIVPRPRDNEWAKAHDLVDVTTCIYAGTLGMKHNPELLLKLAQSLDSSVSRLVVVSEGSGVEWLRRHQCNERVSALSILPFQEYGLLSDVLGAADVLLVLLEPEAGTFSVPSKILTSLCAGRAIVAAIPRENLAARIIEASGGGLVVDPRSGDEFVTATQSLFDDPNGRRERGQAGRRYAEAAFDISPIADQFEHVLRDGGSSALCPQ